MVKKLFLAVLFVGVFSAAEASELLRVKILFKNVKPGDTVIMEIDSEYEIKEAALIDIVKNRRLPCFEFKEKWFCAIGIPSDFNDKDNLFIVPLDVKTELYWHMTQVEVKVGKKIFPRISWPAAQPLSEEDEKRFAGEKEIFRGKIEESYIDFMPVQKFIMPLKRIEKITSSFGERRIRFKPHAARIHNGADLRAKIGTPVLAPNDGMVEIAAHFYFEGGFILLNHGGGIKSDFMHLSKLVVKAGDRVSRGQVIGYSGKSGEGNSSPHLHFEIWIHGTPVDPMKFIKDFNKAIFGKK